MNSIKIATVLLAVSLFVSCSEGEQTYTVSEQKLNEAVYASGELFPQEYCFLKPTITNRISQMTVNEGDRINIGNILVLMETASDKAQAEAMSGKVGIAKNNAGQNSAVISELKSKISLAEQQYKTDKANADRYKELSLQNAVSQKAAEDARIQAERSFAEYANLKDQLSATQNNLEERVFDSQSQYMQFNASREAKILRSPINGKVYQIFMKEGETAGLRDAVLLIGSEDSYKLELMVDERDITRVKIGQKVWFETDTYTGKQFEGEVVKINPVLEKDSRSFKIEVAVKSNEKFYPQTSVEASIMIREKATALVIPTEYLLLGDSVMIKNGAKPQKISVKTGIKSNNRCEIIEGLKAGDVISK